METEVRSLRGLLRRSQFVCPGLTRVGGVGAESLRAAAEAEGMIYDAHTPDLWVVWKPNQADVHVALPSDTVKAVAVVAPGLAGSPLPCEAARRPAKATTTLQAWVGTWPLGKWLLPLLASDAVGARTCSVSLPGNYEMIFLATPSTTIPGQSGGIKELAVTFFGTGLFPIMPATLASGVMLPPALAAWWLWGSGTFFLLAVAVAFLATLASVALEKWAGARFLAEDPREFVLDEVAGMALTWAFLPAASPWWMLIVAFFFFRIFDIFKWGVSWVENLPIRGKIVWDDLIAGFYAGLATLAVDKFLL
ncbi:MAG: phosphatidylglycerophosphatase A [Terrimicrobiaceae bacterium]